MSYNDFLIKELTCFKPLEDKPKTLLEDSGFYIMCLNKDASLPSVLENAKFTRHENLRVLYVGITNSKKGIKGRDYNSHFNGNAGGSTLRKSLGVLFNYDLVPRDKNIFNNKKKFSIENELTLSNWMKKNIIFFYKVHADPNSIEQQLIDLFNPPLNLDKTKHLIENLEIRQRISFLRSKDSPLIKRKSILS